MRWLLGCVGLLIVACVGCMCIGVGAAAIGSFSGGGPVTVLTPGAQPPRISADAAATFRNKTNELNQKIRTQPKGSPIEVSYSRDEVASFLSEEIAKSSDLRSSGVRVENLQIDFRDDRFFAGGKVLVQDTAGRGSSQTQSFEVRGRFKLAPRNDQVQLDPENVEIVGLLPFPIPITSFIRQSIDQGGMIPEIPAPFLVDSISLQNGTLKMTGRTK